MLSSHTGVACSIRRNRTTMEKQSKKRLAAAPSSQGVLSESVEVLCGSDQKDQGPNSVLTKRTKHSDMLLDAHNTDKHFNIAIMSDQDEQSELGRSSSTPSLPFEVEISEDGSLSAQKCPSILLESQQSFNESSCFSSKTHFERFEIKTLEAERRKEKSKPGFNMTGETVESVVSKAPLDPPTSAVSADSIAEKLATSNEQVKAPTFLRRHSKTKIEWDDKRNFRQNALRKIPFSSIFYCSNPLAAALTRKRTQIFFFLLAMVGNLSEFWPTQIFQDLSVQSSVKIRFTTLARRRSSTAVSSNQCSFAGPGIAELGLYKSGQLISVGNSSAVSENSITLSFDAPVEWNEWFFITGAASPEDDPIKFSLETFDGSKWKTIGSSLSMQVTKETLFLHGRFETSTERGARHTFYVLAPSFFGYFAVRFLGDFQGFAMAVLGALGKERLGAQVPNVQASLFVLSMLIASCYPDRTKGDYSAIAHLYFGAMQAGSLFLQLRNEWLLTTLWISSFLIGLGIFLSPHAPEPAIHVLSVGVPWLIAVACVKAFSVWTIYSARRAIADNQRFYETLWAMILEDDASRAANVALEGLLAAEARKLPAPRATEWDLVLSPTRQVLPPRPRGGLLGSECVLADLDDLYAQAEAVYNPFRLKVLGLAAAYGAFLPVPLGSIIGRGEGLELAAAAAAEIGLQRVGSCDSDYVRVSPEMPMEAFRWAELKGAERALEKVPPCCSTPRPRKLSHHGRSAPHFPPAIPLPD